MKQLLLSLFFLLNVLVTHATVLTGIITETNGKQLPFVNVFIKGSTTGTSANSEGKYALDLTPGAHTIVFKIIGYRQIEKQVVIAAATYTLNVIMQTEQYELKEATVTAGEDPANPIIRKAMARRKFYLNQIKEYSADMYIKGWQRITKHPKKIFGQQVDLGGVIDTATGIVYLSESVSQFNFRKPDQVKEIMTSSKVSGSNKSFSFNRGTFFLFNFYENIIDLDLCPRGVVSPVSNNAFLYYKYRLIGSFIENGKTVNKIEVIPRNKYDPAFSGFIYIQDKTWRIHSVDVYLSKDNQLQFVDTFGVHQVMLPVDTIKDIWMVVSNQFYYSFNIFGFVGDGVYMGIASNYNINPSFPKGYFDGEVVKVADGSNKKDTAYWNKIRPVPLTAIEATDYERKDSLMVIKESKPYLDSVDAKRNKFEPLGMLISGYKNTNRYKKIEWGFKPLIENVAFNTVEGVNIGEEFYISKRYEKPKRKLYSSIALRYAFDIKQVYGQVRFNFLYNKKKQSDIGIIMGHDAVQFNPRNPISTLSNSAYSLTTTQNFMKIYQKDFFQINYKTEIINGLMFVGFLEYANRDALTNQTLCSWNKSDKHEYSSNNPQDPANDVAAFEQNQSFMFAGVLRYRFRQKYYSDPENHYILGSDYPVLFLKYRHGFKNILGSDVNFDFINVGVEDELSFGMLGRMKYNLGYGNFLNSQSIYFMDYKHFSGNQTAFSEFQLTDFNILPYYTNSTTSEFYEGHLEHNFGGLFFNKIPLLRKAFLSEIVSVHYLHTLQNTDHFEFSIGVEKLGIIRMDFVSSVAKGFAPVVGFRIGVRTDGFGN